MNKKVMEFLESGKTGVLLVNGLVGGIILTETKSGNDMVIVSVGADTKIMAFEGDGTFEHVSNLRPGDSVTGVIGQSNTSMNQRDLPSGGTVSEKQTVITGFEILAVNEGTFGEKIEGVSEKFYERAPLKKREKRAERSGKTYGEAPTKGGDEVNPDEAF